jgi:outer membrane lipoprotein-sorting protein
VILRLMLVALLATPLPAHSIAAQAGTQQRPSSDAIMNRASRAWQQLTSFQADFRMKIDDPLIDQPETRGRFYQQGTNRWAFRFSDPANTAFVMDGSAVWVYQPEDSPRQVNKYPPPGGPVYEYNRIGWLLDRPLEKYRATWLREELVDGQNTDVLRLEPSAAGIPFRRATIWIDRETVLPRKIELDEKLYIRTITFSRLRTNGTIPPGTFTFRVPDGVRVIEQ